MSRGGAFAWLELLRLSNAPTVASNVLMGVAVGSLARSGEAQVAVAPTAALVAGAVLAYSAGMVLNDAFDARVDAAERPSRPIPSGRVPVARARAVGLAMLAVGTALLAFAGMPGDGSGSPLQSSTFPWAVLLGACVLAYDVLHLQLPGASGLVAGCRALVVTIAALGTSPDASWPHLAWPALALLAYVLGVGIAARDEVRGLGPRARALAWLLPAAAVAAPVGLRWVAGTAPVAGWPLVAAMASAALAAWMAARGIRQARAGRVPAAVGSWLGAIPATDAACCFVLGCPAMGGTCLGLWALAALLRPRIAAS